jgi:cell division protein FtsQ
MTAHAVVVDPRRLPVPIRKPQARALVRINHTWVLHRAVIVRLVALLLAVLAIVGAYEGRGALLSGADTVSGLIQGSFTHAGFAIGAIEITGQTLTQEQAVIKALAIDPTTSTLNFDAEAARARIEELPAVASATVRKVYPRRLVVSIVEKQPVARWRVDGVTFVVDADGEQIGEDGGAYGALPLVIGDGAADNALVMIRNLGRHPDLREHLAALSRIGDRRWDMIYDTGLRVQLPEQGVAQALDRLDLYQRDYALLDRDVTLVDLRVPSRVAVRPTEEAMKQMVAEAKAREKSAPKANFKADDDYQTPAEAAGH